MRRTFRRCDRAVRCTTIEPDPGSTVSTAEAEILRPIGMGFTSVAADATAAGNVSIPSTDTPPPRRGNGFRWRMRTNPPCVPVGPPPAPSAVMVRPIGIGLLTVAEGVPVTAEALIPNGIGLATEPDTHGENRPIAATAPSRRALRRD